MRSGEDPAARMRVAAVVEHGWEAASIEVDPVSGDVDWARAASAPAPGSLEVVELALRLGTATVYGFGGGVERLLQNCLAVGVERAARAPDLPSLAAALERERFDLVLVPHRSLDQGPSLLGPLLAGLLDLPQATAVDQLVLRAEARELVVRRRLDRGERVELALPLPAVVALEPGLVEPRAATPAALVASGSRRMDDVPAAPAAGPWPQLVMLGRQAPRPPPPRLRRPDPALPAEARIDAVLGAADSRQRDVASGTPDEVAARIVRLLRERGYLPER